MGKLEALEIILLTQCLLFEQVNKQTLKFQQVIMNKLIHNTQPLMSVTGANHACLSDRRHGDRKCRGIRELQGAGKRPIAEKFGGVYRVRGGDMEVFETDLWSPTRMVIVEFPDMQSARAFVESEEYAPVKPLRLDNARCTMAILDGL